MSDSRSGTEEWRRRKDQIELDYKRAVADEKDAVAFLAGIMSRKTKKRIRSEIENGIEFPPRLYSNYRALLGTSIRNALRHGGFRYHDLVMDAVWYSWLRNAVCLPKKEIETSFNVRKRIWSYQARAFYHYPFTKWVFLGFGYAAALGVSLVKVQGEPIYMIPLVGLIMLPFYALLFLSSKYLW